jgi:hypothetical protein
MKTHHAIAWHPLGYSAADRDDRAGKFVAEDLRRLDVTLEDFLDVRAADAASGDLDQHFAIADFRDGDFLDADLAFVAIDTGAHGFWDRPNRVQSL